MYFSNVKTPKCPDGYKLQSDRRTANLCKCVKKRRGSKSSPTRTASPRSSSSKYLKLKQRYTVKNKGKDGRCPSGTRYNKSTGMCEKRHKKHSLMSAMFKNKSPEIKTRRKQYSPKRIKKRAKCPDGYFLNKKHNVCQRRTKGEYYAKFARLADAGKTARGKTARAASYYDRYFGKRSGVSTRKRTAKKSDKSQRKERTAKTPRTLKKPKGRNYLKTVSPRGLKGLKIYSPPSRRGKTQGKTVKFNRNVKTIRSPQFRKPITLARTRSPQKILKNREGTPLEIERLGQSMRHMIKDNPEKAATIRDLGKQLGIRTRAKPIKRVETRF